MENNVNKSALVTGVATCGFFTGLTSNNIKFPALLPRVAYVLGVSAFVGGGVWLLNSNHKTESDVWLSKKTKVSLVTGLSAAGLATIYSHTSSLPFASRISAILGFATYVSGVTWFFVAENN